jgi:hypothetical protein
MRSPYSLCRVSVFFVSSLVEKKEAYEITSLSVLCVSVSLYPR